MSAPEDNIVDVGFTERGCVFIRDRHAVSDLVSLIRFAFGTDDVIIPHTSKVKERYASWLAPHADASAVVTGTQRWWVDRIAEAIANSAGVTADDLGNVPFSERGGVDGTIRDLGPGAGAYLQRLNEQLTG